MRKLLHLWSKLPGTASDLMMALKSPLCCITVCLTHWLFSFKFFFFFRVRIDNWMRGACGKVGFSCRRLPLKLVFPSWLPSFFFFSSCDLASALSISLSGSCTKKAKAIWQPPPDKREVVEQEEEEEVGVGGYTRNKGEGGMGGGWGLTFLLPEDCF